MKLPLTLALILACGCGGDESAPEPPAFALNESARTTGMVTAAAGGTITAPTGDALSVPPGAVEEDVEIALTPFALEPDPDAAVLGGVKLEPDGLVFLVPATLTLALAAPVEPGDTLGVGETSGALVALYDAGYPFVVDDTGTRAAGPIYGFSGKCLERVCHAGTREQLLAAWQGLPGRSSKELAATLGLTEAELRACYRVGDKIFSAETLQRMMTPHFAPCGTFPVGTAFSQAARSQVEATIGAGRTVVMLFSEEGKAIGGTPGTDVLTSIDHSAVVVKDEKGKLVIRNQLFIAKPDVKKVTGLDSKSANRIVDLPLDDIDAEGGMRDKRNSEVAREIQGKPLTDEERNTRPRAWANVVVFCEKPRDGPMCIAEPLPNGSCNGGSLFCIGMLSPCASATGEGCCPAGMCNYGGGCVQLECPAGSGRNYDCECCCTAGMGDAGSCGDTETIFNVRDACRADRLCGCASAPPTDAKTCP